ncbi:MULTISPECIES: substrate-binding periplasmic protein [Pseudomonas]|uniref:ABC transporter substrate-binding protein n=1 Tax=Pseudomonas monteilii SB3101 TaxID=1435058 RepID=V9V995_9PSED|nr:MULTISPECIES: transporter substrate-binding domain-containing protein [Pseudomonas]AHC85034.1 ABC transporter substrate-binding protein [Pseudomonas monteilii SB3078]AHC90405.1 ABC transporter substrate-binding protein [Pseudomonas monteilii SB3101]KAF4562413.1 transporter substrate-binding domain-containing protein [Pseudomonas sp. CES]MBF8801725.1 transporter substrate-binding domain-containing protein [Pseudomonas asiatica]MBH3378897.1 transporter substrate-binding domain-containing prot
MRSIIGVMLAVLITPLAQAELIDEIADRGELRIAVQADNSPYAFKENDHLSGFEIDFGQALAKELDLRAEFIEAPAAEVLPGVESGKYDIALTPSSESPKGDSPLDVSLPFGEKQLVIPFQKDNPAFESAVNNALQRLKDSGRTAELEQKWFKGVPETAAGQ